MTHKDFELIAAALKESRTYPRMTGSPVVDLQWRRTCNFVAGALATTNPNFNEPYFMAACGNVAVEGEA